jgi:hypothetical protein
VLKRPIRIRSLIDAEHDIQSITSELDSINDTLFFPAKIVSIFTDKRLAFEQWACLLIAVNFDEHMM